jgi:SAM-dependent methyltransferase
VTERWNDYFARQGALESGWLSTAVDSWKFNENLFGKILVHCPRPARLLDVGCGPAWSSLYLASLGYEVTGVDNEPRLLEFARLTSERLGVRLRVELADAFNLQRFYGKYDLAFSCGVLEHFDRNVTVRLLREQARCASKVLIQIPSKYTSLTGQITDERIYSMLELRRIVREAGLEVLESFGFGDVTVTRGQIWCRRLMPRGVYRAMQNMGYAFAIAVVGQSRLDI